MTNAVSHLSHSLSPAAEDEVEGKEQGHTAGVDRGWTRVTTTGDQGKQEAEERRDEGKQARRSERSSEHSSSRSSQHTSSPSSKLAQHSASAAWTARLQVGEHRVSSQLGEERGWAREEVGDESGSPCHTYTSHVPPCHTSHVPACQHVPLIPQSPPCVATEGGGGGGGRGQASLSRRPSTNPLLHTHSHANATGSGGGRSVSAGVSGSVSAEVSLPSAASPAVPSACAGGNGETMRRRYGEAMRHAMRRRFYVDPKAKASRLLSALMRDKGWEQCASLPHPRRCDCLHCFKVTTSHSKSKSPF